jgi:hypothetical protein
MLLPHRDDAEFAGRPRLRRFSPSALVRGLPKGCNDQGGLMPMKTLKVTIAEEVFEARLELENAPQTCAAFIERLPFESQIVHVRWSGEGVWMPLGDYQFGVGYENHTSYPAPGQIILYPGGISETEILLAYGGVHFASKMGQLAGNHFLTLTSGLDRLADLGRRTLWKGAQPIRFEAT